MSTKARVENEPSFILHSYPYRETSLIVEVFSRSHGRVAMVARGAKRPKSAVRGLLLAFQPLWLSWFGKTELRTLHRAEWQAAQPQMAGTPLLCGFYLNELLLRLSQREDPHEALFDFYDETLRALRQAGNEGSPALAPILRRFELRLLQELGYAVQLEVDAETGAPIEPDRVYQFVLERGLVAGQGAAARAPNGLELAGRALLNMARGEFSDPLTAAQSKQLTRLLMQHYLGGQPLYTRQLMKELQQL